MTTLRPTAPTAPDCREPRPTLAYPRCACGGALDPRHRCADPVADAAALRLAAEDAEDALAPAQRAELHRRIRAVLVERALTRLARGPG